MKILIITYSREVNPGTFLQAYGVQYAFRQLYPNAQIDLIKHKRMYSIAAEKKNVTATNESKLSFFKAKARHIVPSFILQIKSLISLNMMMRNLKLLQKGMT